MKSDFDNKKLELGNTIDKLAKCETHLEWVGLGDLVEESGLRKAIDRINKHYCFMED